eukprot:CAMPEP_0185904778 /NCGR_PEP_ID=MMETSP0196C-20130402/4060_1 /TAXON_ID=2932 /ORGANISM="Alexandrium fundyense, Strain CCMP1719" /LENGTH=68 /DNA_ID=CAMNT_0028624157 /DNA_START=163 /DNA_END=365 /DNA_ORIENTATION=+
MRVASSFGPLWVATTIGVAHLRDLMYASGWQELGRTSSDLLPDVAQVAPANAQGDFLRSQTSSPAAQR